MVVYLSCAKNCCSDTATSKERRMSWVKTTLNNCAKAPPKGGAPALSALDRQIVYRVIRSHRLTGDSADVVDFTIHFRDYDAFGSAVVPLLRDYVRLRACECDASDAFSAQLSAGAAAALASPRSEITCVRRNAAKCVCAHDYVNLSRVMSPHFLGTSILADHINTDIVYSSDDGGVEELDADSDFNSLCCLIDETLSIGSSDTFRNPPSTPPDWSAASQCSTHTVPPKSRSAVEKMLREADFFRRMTRDPWLDDVIGKIVTTSIVVDDPTFVQMLCQEGRLFAELLIQYITRPQDQSLGFPCGGLKASMLLKHAESRVVKYLMTLWQPDKEHDFVYRATLREVLETDNVAAFKLLAPSMTLLFYKSYSPLRYLLLDLVKFEAFKILDYIAQNDLCGSELRKISLLTFAGPRRGESIESLELLKVDRLKGFKKMLQVVADHLDYNIVLNRTVIDDDDTSVSDDQLTPRTDQPVEKMFAHVNWKVSNPLMDYLLKVLPTPTWLTTGNYTGCGTYLTRHYQDLTPAAIYYLLSVVQPCSVNWVDSAGRSTGSALRWGKHGIEKLSVLFNFGLKLTAAAFDSLLAQKQFWKLEEEHIEIIAKRVTDL